MKKIVFFPYHPDLLTVIDHRAALRGFEIGGFISFKEDAQRIQALNEALGVADTSYEHLLQSCDVVILLDNYRDFRPDKYYQIFGDACRYQKEILVTPHAQAQLDLTDYQGQYKLLERLPEDMGNIENEYKLHKEIKIYEVNVPIIGVFGHGKHCEKFKTQLLLKEALEDYETIAVSSNALGALFGCYTIPSFIFEDRPFHEKIIKFNYYIRMLSKLDTPDVIALGIPEGIAPFREKEFNHFAEYPLIVSSAVSIDMAILCTYLLTGARLEDGLKEIMDFFEQKYEIAVGLIAISRTLYDIPIEVYEKLIFEFLDESFLDEHYPDVDSLNLPMINMRNYEKAVAAIKASLKQLQENVRGV
jgi:peptide maturation system protein (TIGR04066 family)